MSRLIWSKPEEICANNISRVVLYVQNQNGGYSKGVAWNGITGLAQNSTGGKRKRLYADNTVYGTILSPTGLEGTIEAYDFPAEFVDCIGARAPSDGVYVLQQGRKRFGFCYRTMFNSRDYLLNIVYGASAGITHKVYTSHSQSPSPTAFSWDYDCFPELVDGFKPTASVSLDSRKIRSRRMEEIENVLYGNDLEDAYLPSLPDLIELAVNGEFRKLLIRAFNVLGLWRWDPFNFEEDTVPIAIERESKTRVHFGSVGSSIVPCIYYEILDNPITDPTNPLYEATLYKTTVIAETDDSPLFDSVAEIPNTQLIDSYVRDSLYYHIYTIYY